LESDDDKRASLKPRESGGGEVGRAEGDAGLGELSVSWKSGNRLFDAGFGAGAASMMVNGGYSAGTQGDWCRAT